MKFAIYISGQILRTVTCNADDIASQLNSGELHISMEEGDDSTHYIVNGVLTQFPLRPGNHHTFDFASDSWIDLRSSPVPFNPARTIGSLIQG